MAKTLTRPEDRREYTPEQKSKAYLHWRKSGSMRRTAEALGIPDGTIIAWSRAQGWTMMKQSDDARDREVIVANARMRLVDEADSLVEGLIDLSKTADKDAGVRLRALIKALELIGMDGKEGSSRFAVQRREPATSPLSSPERDALSKFLLNIIEEGPPSHVGPDADQSGTDAGVGPRGPEREQGGDRHPLYAFAHGIASELPGRTEPGEESGEIPGRVGEAS